MKRFISFVLFIVISAILSSHNSVMAFGDSMENMLMCDHEQVEIKETNINNVDIDDCESICCFDNDLGSSKIVNINSQTYKKKLDKIKYTHIDLDFAHSFIYEWNLIGNISPPYISKNLKKNNYTSLIGTIKSNT